MKVALLEVSHWHFPLYAKALHSAGIDVVAVSDREESFRSSVAKDFGAKAYADWQKLLSTEMIDFAFAFGRHVDMPEIGHALIDRHIPFAIEKPCGVKPMDVGDLANRAISENVFAAVPFTMRISPIIDALRNIADGLPCKVTHFSFRQLSGPPSRYLENGSPWLLDPEIAGGGCAINLAIHYIDLAHLITGSDVVLVTGNLSNLNYDTPVEDYARITLDLTSGASGVIETGYCFPTTGTEKREFVFSIGTQRIYLRSTPSGIRAHPRDGRPFLDLSMDLDQDPLYGQFVEVVLESFRQGIPPFAGLEDAYRALCVVDAAYQSNKLRTAVQLKTECP